MSNNHVKNRSVKDSAKGLQYNIGAKRTGMSGYKSISRIEKRQREEAKQCHASERSDVKKQCLSEVPDLYGPGRLEVAATAKRDQDIPWIELDIQPLRGPVSIDLMVR
ncbi:hypothetical protein RRG08_014421 [Elysia crispata]|uniref:Uncharacterized protein n=1 Tax=Elysia crispata TaxID=231223 RepID=A0AAE0YVK3_9GAST|nr:hypothetical protein RRG08_014421 [Elysia crispata]